NFKAARFESDAHTDILRKLQADIEASRFEIDGTKVELPVKLKVHDSVYVPLAKWAMLIAGNYRCVLEDTVRPIKEAVHSDLDESRAVYNWVVEHAAVVASDEHRSEEHTSELQSCENLVYRLLLDEKY